MSLQVFEKIFAACIAESDYFRKGLRPDATEKLGISFSMKTATAFTTPWHGISADFGKDAFKGLPMTTMNFSL